MKKLMLIFATAITVLSLVSCMGTGSNMSDTDKNDGMAVSENAQNVPDTASSESNPDTASFIGEERAKEIALERAGVTADGVFFDRVELDKDRGEWLYEVEFTKDGIEYDAEIKADDGSILSWETDYDD